MIQNENVLVIMPNNLGDVITALPVIEALKKKNNSTSISFLVEEGFDGGLINSPFCDSIIYIPRKTIKEASRTENWTDGLNLLTELVNDLKNRNFTCIVNLSQHAYISYIAGIFSNMPVCGRKVLSDGNNSLNDPWSQYLYAIPFGRSFNSLHVTDIYKHIAGVGDIATENQIYLTNEELEDALMFISGQGYDPKEKWIIFQPGAAYSSKRWPIEQFVALGKLLVKQGKKILVTGSSEDVDLAAGIKESLGESCCVAAGKRTFRESIALISLCEACITGDTAIMHAASALPKRVFALFGPTNPVETGPYGQGHIVFAGKCTNRPCFCIECKSKLCMKSITAETVFAYIKNESVSTPGCDVYRTDKDRTGAYRLVPIHELSSQYSDQAASALTRKFIQPDLPLTEGDFSEHATESVIFCSNVASMSANLERFIHTGDTQYIRQYESVRKEQESFSGIATFWAAILNIRLNSVPLLDPVAGVKESIAVCNTTIKEIRAVFTK